MTSAIQAVSSMATKALLTDLFSAWHAQGGAPVHLESAGGVDVARRVAAGESWDLVVLAADAIARLAEGGHVDAASTTALVHSDVAIAVRQGAPRPAIATAEQLRAAVVAAPRIAFSTGPSGTALQRLFNTWGLADTLEGRLVQASPGIPVGQLVAHGDADLGFQQLSELMNLQGIDVLGTMPPGLEIVTTFSAARCIPGGHAGRVQPLLDFLGSPATGDAKRRHGMSPAHA